MLSRIQCGPNGARPDALTSSPAACTHAHVLMLKATDRVAVIEGAPRDFPLVLTPGRVSLGDPAGACGALGDASDRIEAHLRLRMRVQMRKLGSRTQERENTSGEACQPGG